MSASIQVWAVGSRVHVVHVRSRTEVKGSTHWDCNVEASIYEGGDRDQLMGSNTASVGHMGGEKAVCGHVRESEPRIAARGKSVARKSVKVKGSLGRRQRGKCRTVVRTDRAFVDLRFDIFSTVTMREAEMRGYVHRGNGGAESIQRVRRWTGALCRVGLVDWWSDQISSGSWR
jgi:hypothetical protein